MHSPALPKIRKCTKKVLIFRIVLILLLVLNYSFIWHNSSKVSKASDKTSKTIARDVAKVVVKDYNKLSPRNQQKHVNKLNGTIRSFGHFIEFVPLGFLLFMLGAVLFDFNKRKLLYVVSICTLFSVILSLVCALSDETHQIFVQGRSFQVSDMAVDTLGALLGCVVAALPVCIFKKRIL